MESIWLILLIIAILALFVLFFKRIRPWLLKLLLILLTLFAIGFFSFKYVIPMNAYLPLEGDFAIINSQEFISYPYHEQFQTAEGMREVPISLWHPEEVADSNGQLFLFSHGSFGVADSNDSLFRELASQGYVVASLGHPYHSFITTLEAGQNIFVDSAYLQETMDAQGHDNLEESWKDITSWSQLHEDDIVAVIEALQKDQISNPYLESVDSEQIILAGHSLGGTAALKLGRERKDILAVIALESPFAGDILSLDGDTYQFISEPYPIPMLNIYSDATWDNLKDGWPIYAQNGYYVAENNPKYVSVHIAGSGHLGLTDLYRVSPILTNLVDQDLNTNNYRQTLEQINDSVLAFLDKL